MIRREPNTSYRPPPRGGVSKANIMSDCKIEVTVLMKNVPDDKKLKLMNHIKDNVGNYAKVIGCEMVILLA